MTPDQKEAFERLTQATSKFHWYPLGVTVSAKDIRTILDALTASRRESQPAPAADTEKDMALFDRDGLAKAIRMQVAERGLTMKQAAVEIGVSHSSLCRVANLGKEPNVEGYLRIQQWLKPAADTGQVVEYWITEREGCSMNPRLFTSFAEAQAWADSINVNPPVKIERAYTHPAPLDAIPRAKNCGRYLAEGNDGQWYYLNHANTWQGYQGPFDAERVREDERDRLLEIFLAYGDGFGWSSETVKYVREVMALERAMLPADRAALRQKEGEA